MAEQKLIYGKGGIHHVSYSKLQEFHRCPRKFYLKNGLNAVGLKDPGENCDFSFGHAVGAGIQQLLLEPKNLRKAVIAAFARWDLPLHVEDLRKKKSVWYSIRAVQNFYALLSSSSQLGRRYKLAHFKDKEGNSRPAIELHFNILMPDGFTYEGHIDLVLQEIGTENYIVLELKTSSFSNIHDASFKNSMQATGYSLVLDTIYPNSAQYVFYLIYKSGKMEFEEKVFSKTTKDKLNLLSTLISDVETIQTYEKNGFWPMRGGSCYDFFKPCEFFGVCEMEDSTLRRPMEAEQHDIKIEKVEYDFEFDLLQSIDSLIARAERDARK